MALAIMNSVGTVYVPSYLRLGDALPRTHHGDGIIEFNFRSAGVVWKEQDNAQVFIFGDGFTVTEITPSHVKVTRP